MRHCQFLLGKHMTIDSIATLHTAAASRRPGIRCDLTVSSPIACLPPFRATEQAMSRELKGESGVMETWLETSITGLHALVGRIQVRNGRPPRGWRRTDCISYFSYVQRRHHLPCAPNVLSKREYVSDQILLTFSSRSPSSCLYEMYY